MTILHVSYAFAEATENTIDSFTAGILSNLYSQSAYPTPPITSANLVNSLTAFTDALAAMANAGPSATATKDLALEALINDLRALAGYVDEHHHNNMATLLSSGFKAASTNRSQSPLPQATIRKIDFAGNGRLLVEAGTMDNVKSWEAQWKPELAPDSAYAHAKNLGAGRKMTVTDLPQLTRVTIQMRGVGGSEGYGEWSDGVTHPVT